MKLCTVVTQHFAVCFENLEVKPISLKASKCGAKKGAAVDNFGLSDTHFTHLTSIISKTARAFHVNVDLRSARKELSKNVRFRTVARRGVNHRPKYVASLAF